MHVCSDQAAFYSLVPYAYDFQPRELSMKSITTLVCIATVALLAGCEMSGASGRIEEKSAVFSSLTPEQKQIIEAGDIDIGFTPDMVYMALGKASKSEVKDSPDGTVTLWTYNRYYPSNRAISISVSYASGMDNVSSRSLPYERRNAPQADQSRRGFVENSGPTMAPEPADLPADTLYVFFFKGKVFDLKLASQG
jgi:hypothetical protein